MRVVSMTLGAHLFLSVAGFAGPPLIENADLEVVSSQSSLGSQVETWTETVQGTAWLGWHVPMVDRDQVLCCQNQACSLESTHRHFVSSSARSGSPRAAEILVILLRATDGQLEEMQIYSDGCRLDAGGSNLIWLEGVQPEESVTFLDRLIEADPKIEDEALMAMALHATPTAAERLAGMARQSPDPDLRGEALFWLSHTGASTASEVILLALAEDPDAEVKDQALFALSQLPDQEGIPLLLEILRDRSRPAAVREEAFFWYVQSGDEEALDLIAEILRD